MSHKSFIFFLIMMVFPLFKSVAASDTTIQNSVGVGYFYSHGQFDDGDSSKLMSIPLYLKTQRKLTSLKLSGYLYRYRREDSVSRSVQQRRGWGNSYLTFKHLVKTPSFIHYFDIEGKAKIPLSEKADGLRTTGLDVKLGTTLYRYVDKRWITVTFSYRWRGDKTMRNSYLIGGGVTWVVAPRLRAGAQFGIESQTQDTSSKKLENTLYLQWRQNKQVNYSVYSIKGFNDLKLDWALGLQVSYGW